MRLLLYNHVQYKFVKNNILPELERMSLDTRGFTEYYEELADVNNLLDDFNFL